MAYACEVCGKTFQTGFNVSHSHHKTKKRFMPNLRRVKIVVDGRPVRMRICAQCLKSTKVVATQALAPKSAVKKSVKVDAQDIEKQPPQEESESKD